ncbi:MAG: nitroreductase/quinone reductase family protein [Candidatus Limnocylindrales bacterium]
MTGHPLGLRMSWQIHRAMDRLSCGRLAREATAAERERLWPRLVQLFRDYARYEAGTSRPIPVVILEPRTAG